MSAPLPLVELPVEPLDWSRLFAEPRPVHLEIGAGKGAFLIRAAESCRSINWVGLERRWSTLAVGVERIVKRGLDNAVYVRCDAMEVLRRLVPPASVAAIHVYYPDPWWKERQKKRRIFTPAFIADAARALESSGELRVVTDVGEYFDEIRASVSGSGLFEPLDLPEDAWGFGGDPLTSFEAKYLKLGRKPFRSAFQRNDAPAPPPEPWLSRKPRGAPLADRLLAPRLAKR